MRCEHAVEPHALTVNIDAVSRDNRSTTHYEHVAYSELFRDRLSSPQPLQARGACTADERVTVLPYNGVDDPREKLVIGLS